MPARIQGLNAALHVELSGFPALSRFSRPSLDVSKMAMTAGTGSQSCVRTNERAHAKLLDWCLSHGSHSDSIHCRCSVGGHLLLPFKRLSPNRLLLADRLSSRGQPVISTNSRWWLCGTSSSPYLIPSYLTPACLCGSCVLAPKSPRRGRAGSLLLRLLSRLSVDFDGCVLQPRAERRLQSSTQQSLAAKIRELYWVKTQGCVVGPS